MPQPSTPATRTAQLRGVRTLLSALLLIACAWMPAAAGEAITTSEAMEERLAALAEHPGVVVETIGTSVGGTPLRAVRVTPPARMAIRHRILFVGAQHGNEHAGKEAILDLLDDLAEGELTLPPGVELHAIPMANPDGVDADQRRNGNDFDLNRDHVILSQPETRALHAYAQRVKPTVVVDCHEFTRDSGSYADRGWGEWPLIMMDGANSPLLPGGTLDLGLGWVEAAEEPMADAGFAYQRYLVGGPPPENELRPSTLDADDARNGLSFDGGLGFIIESGIKRSADDPQADLPERVAAYRVLLDRFLTDTQRLEETRAALDAMAEEPVGPSVVTNALWARTEPGVVPYPVVDLASGGTVRVPALNFATARSIKTQVATPAGYAIDATHAEAHAGLLAAHAVPFDRIEKPRRVRAEAVELLAVEEDDDETHGRYGGRQITRSRPAGEVTLPATSPTRCSAAGRSRCSSRSSSSASTSGRIGGRRWARTACCRCCGSWIERRAPCRLHAGQRVQTLSPAKGGGTGGRVSPQLGSGGGEAGGSGGMRGSKHPFLVCTRRGGWPAAFFCVASKSTSTPAPATRSTMADQNSSAPAEAAGAYTDPSTKTTTRPPARNTASNPLPKILAAVAALAVLLLVLWALGVFGGDDDASDADRGLDDRSGVVDPATPGVPATDNGYGTAPTVGTGE